MEDERNDFAIDEARYELKEEERKNKPISIFTIREGNREDLMDCFFRRPEISQKVYNENIKRIDNPPEVICEFDGKQVEVTNIMFVSNIGCDLIDLQMAACLLTNCEYKPTNTLHPLTMVLRTSDSTVVCCVTRSGKLKILNCKSEAAMIPLMRIFVRKLQKIATHICRTDKFKLCRPKIGSITAKMNLQFKLQSLEKFADEFQHDANYTVIYDPEISPSLNISNRKVHMKVTSNGHVNFCGAKSILDIKEFISFWYPILLKHKAQVKVISEKLMNVICFEAEIKNKKIKMEDLQQHFPASLVKLLCGGGNRSK